MARLVFPQALGNAAQINFSSPVFSLVNPIIWRRKENAINTFYVHKEKSWPLKVQAETSHEDWLYSYLTHQHVFCKPPFIPGNNTGDSQSKTLLPQEWVTSISTAIGHDLSLRWSVSYHNSLWVTWPVINYLPYNNNL